jgi:hypothetical protein
MSDCVCMWDSRKEMKMSKFLQSSLTHSLTPSLLSSLRTEWDALDIGA